VKIIKNDGQFRGISGAWLVIDPTKEAGSPESFLADLPTRDAARGWIRAAKAAPPAAPPAEQPNHEPQAVEPPTEGLLDAGELVGAMAGFVQKHVPGPATPATLPTGVEVPTPAPVPMLQKSRRLSAPSFEAVIEMPPAGLLADVAADYVSTPRPSPSPRSLGRRTALGLALRVTGLDDLLPAALQGPAERGVVVAPYACLSTGRAAV
jgi:hypothetical protein